MEIIVPQKTKINWPWKPLYTWNPVTGCRRGCSWCYARKIWNRFHKTRTGLGFTDIHLWLERLRKAPQKKVKHVFIGSMSDIAYWKPEWVDMVNEYCEMYPEINFYTLSKNAVPYRGDPPENISHGLTMTLEETTQQQYEKIMVFGDKNRFLSIEPLLGTMKLTAPFLRNYKAIIVGKMTGPGAIIPKTEWINSIKTLNLQNIFWKQQL